MATQRETTEFILEQLQGAGETRVQAMFGEYALYLDGKVLGFVCDDTLFLKDTPGARALIDAPETGPAYPGSKPYLIGATLLLCARKAGQFITGAEIYVDGGFTGMRF